jgi:hypothetical protein
MGCKWEFVAGGEIIHEMKRRSNIGIPATDKKVDLIRVLPQSLQAGGLQEELEHH